MNWYTKAEDVLPSLDLSDHIIIITGSNTGIGLETARVCMKQHATVVFACRDTDKARQAIYLFPDSYKSDVIHLDLASLASVRTFCAKFCEKYARLDVLINNAGVMAPPYSLTSDGFEIQMGVNYLGHFLLTTLLLPHLAPAGRVVSVSSMGHKLSLLNIDDLNSERYATSRLYGLYYKWVQYGNSKLAQIMFTKELDRRLKERGSNITCYSLHPGCILTDLWQYVSILYWLMYVLFSVLCKSVEQGAATTVFCALHPNLEQHSGRYFKDCRTLSPTLPLKHKEKGRLLWERSEELVKEKSETI